MEIAEDVSKDSCSAQPFKPKNNTFKFEKTTEIPAKKECNGA